MPNDILDPGPENDYPYWPRDENGVPLQIGPEPKRKRARSPKGEEYDVLNPRHYDSNGELIVPPTIPPSND